MGDHNGHSKMTVIWWLYRKRSEQSFAPHSEAARMPTNLASQVSGQASLTEDGLARTLRSNLTLIEAQAMSQIVSPVSGRRYGLATVCRVWRMARSGVYRHLAPARATPPRHDRSAR
jgi:hypothetical protein